VVAHRAEKRDARLEVDRPLLPVDVELQRDGALGRRFGDSAGLVGGVQR
jgi:hypothetical protein